MTWKQAKLMDRARFWAAEAAKVRAKSGLRPPIDSNMSRMRESTLLRRFIWEPSVELTSLRAFVTTLAGHIAAEAARTCR